jgi:hypothetical protein
MNNLKTAIYILLTALLTLVTIGLLILLGASLFSFVLIKLVAAFFNLNIAKYFLGITLLTIYFWGIQYSKGDK